MNIHGVELEKCLGNVFVVYSEIENEYSIPVHQYINVKLINASLFINTHIVYESEAKTIQVDNINRQLHTWQ